MKTISQTVVPVEYDRISLCYAISRVRLRAGWASRFGFFLLAATASSAGPQPSVDQVPGLTEALEKAIHQVGADASGRLRAESPVQRLAVEFTPSRVWFQHPDAGRFALALSAVGRSEVWRKAEAAAPVASGNRVEYRRGSGITEWWSNSREGFEQGFTLEQKPQGRGLLVATLQIEGGLTAEPESMTSAQLLRDGKAVLRYSGLRAWDADHRPLPTSLRARSTRIELVTDDSGARYPITIDPWVQTAQLVPNGRTPSLFSYGVSVAVSGDTAIVAASVNCAFVGFSCSGSTAFVFVRSGLTWTEQARLQYDGNPGPVALSGDLALLASVGNGIDGTVRVMRRSGTTWVYDGLPLRRNRLLNSVGCSSKSTPVDNAQFGYSIAIFGSTAIVGAPEEGCRGQTWGGENFRSGAAYIFTRAFNGWSSTPATLLPADGSRDGRFGHSVALFDTVAVVGAPLNDDSLGGIGGIDAGAAYVFTRAPAGTWSQPTKLLAKDGTIGSQLGFSTAVRYGVVLLGAPFNNNGSGAAYAYRYDTARNQWLQAAKLTRDLPDEEPGEWFGYSVAISGSQAVIGAPKDNNPNGVAAGGVYFYTFDGQGNNWTRTTKQIADDGQTGDQFGKSVALSAGTAIVGATSAAVNTLFTERTDGKTYVFEDRKTFPVTITSSPAGMTFTVTGSGCEPGTYTAPRTFNWSVENYCTVAFENPQKGPSNLSGTRYRFNRWSDGSTDATRQLFASEPTTYKAEFVTQYYLNTLINPAGTGSVTGAGWYDAGTSAPISAVPNSGLSFINWTGQVASATSASTTAFIAGPLTVTANFRQVISMSLAPISAQYSDGAKISATISPADAVFSGVLSFALNGQGVGAAVPVTGGGVYTTTFTADLASSQYLLTVVLIPQSSTVSTSVAFGALTVQPEDAVLTPTAGSITAPPGVVTLRASLSQAADGSLGDLVLASVTGVLASGEGRSAQSCAISRLNNAVTATCPSVPAGTYVFQWRVTGSYFSAPPVDVPVTIL